MTIDAFNRAQELNNQLEAVRKLRGIISNSTLGGGDYHAAHDQHVKEDELILCYMSKAVDKYDCNVKVYKKGVEQQYHMDGYILGEDIPIELANALELTIHTYENKINKEFKNLSGNYVDKEEE